MVRDGAALASDPVGGYVSSAEHIPVLSRETSRRTTQLGQLPALALVAAVGFALVTVAYAGARAGASWSAPCYWLGEVVMFVPLAARVVLKPDLGRAEAVGLVVVGAVLQYLVRYAYSPLGFSFSDELSHLQTTRQILLTHELFHANYLLPVSPQYPGLELVTSAVALLSGTSIFVSGLIVVGVAHLLLIVALFALLWGASGSLSVAALGALLYETNPHYQFFDSFFVYQNIAVPLLVVVVLAVALQAGQLAGVRGMGYPRRGRLPGALIILLLVAAIVISHHVTTFVLVGVLLLLAGFHGISRHGSRRLLVSPRGRHGRWLAGLAALAAGMAASWMLLVATDTFRYLGPTASDVTSSVAGLFGEGFTVARGGSAPTPLADALLTYALSGVIVATLPLAVWFTLRARRSVLAAFLGLCALAYYALIGIRLASPDGAELAGRAFTFVYIPVSFALATASFALLQSRLRRRISIAVILAGVAILFVGGLASGWPPWWERLPGGYQVSGLERSLSPPDYAVADWFGSQLPPGRRVAVDLADYPLIGSIGRQDVIRDGGELFYSRSLDAASAAFIRQASVRYVVTDRRLATALPASGRYFPDDPRAYEHRSPISLSALDKFNRTAGVSRVYDNGDIAVFDLKGSRYSP